MIYKTRDPLQEALKERTNAPMYIPFGSGDYFPNKVDLQHFGLSMSQRFMAFIILLILAIVSFFYSMTKIFSAFAYSPAKFAIPYAFSNLMFFFMIGFVIGFKTYLNDLTNKDKRLFTISFILSTLFTIYIAPRTNYLFALIILLGQIISFLCFVITFVPGGSSGLKTFAKMLVKR